MLVSAIIDSVSRMTVRLDVSGVKFLICHKSEGAVAAATWRPRKGLGS
jgi:hypothetical protein